MPGAAETHRDGSRTDRRGRADFSLQPAGDHLEIAMLLVYLHPLATTVKIGEVGFNGHRFGRMHVMFGPDHHHGYMEAGIGAPDLFAVGSRALMAFNAARTDGVRSIGLAERATAEKRTGSCCRTSGFKLEWSWRD